MIIPQKNIVNQFFIYTIFKHPIWPSVLHLSAKSRPFCQDRSVWSCLRCEAEVQQDAACASTDRAGWQDSQGQQKNTFRITLFQSNAPQSLASSLLTADNSHCIQWGLADQTCWESSTGYHSSCRYPRPDLMSYTNQVLLITSGMKHIFFSADDFPSMWLCSFFPLFLTMWKYLEKSFHFLLIISLLQTFIDTVYT